MDFNLKDELQKIVKGEVKDDETTLESYSHDASIFELKPRAVVFPTDTSDLTSIVKFINDNKNKYKNLSVTPRSAGTDMSGGVLTESILVSFPEHLNKIHDVENNRVIVEPGAYYKDLEVKTLDKGLIFPAYPASREICAVGGMIANNCGGEKSLEYGKADKYVEKMKVIFSDGEEYELEALNEDRLKEKLSLRNFEGDLYRKIYRLINDNYDLIKKAKPDVSKNSSGYALWDVYDKDAKTFDLTKLFVGSQGTLGIITEATLKLVPVKKHSQMAVIYMYDADLLKLGSVLNTILNTQPESIEAYDDKTLKLALKYFADFSSKLGVNILSTALLFMPEFILQLTGRIPKLVIQVEYTGEVQEIKNKISALKSDLKQFALTVKDGGRDARSKKYWSIRRQSFSLLKTKIKDMYSSPFIDDFVVAPKYLTEFLPKLNRIMDKYPSIIFTIAGHLGQGNFHIIPLVNLREDSEVMKLKSLQKEVFDLVFEYKGTTSGEHNDGLIRSQFVEPMFGKTIYNLFFETKKIFDPDNIFNPGKKVEADFEYSIKHVRKSW